MPQRKASIKGLRVDKKRRLRNLKIKEDLKKSLKNFQRLLAAKNTQEAKKSLKECVSKLAILSRKGLIAKNFANRKKSQLATALNKIA